jgi:hypothetical protein
MSQVAIFNSNWSLVKIKGMSWWGWAGVIVVQSNGLKLKCTQNCNNGWSQQQKQWRRKRQERWCKTRRERASIIKWKFTRTMSNIEMSDHWGTDQEEKFLISVLSVYYEREK